MSSARRWKYPSARARKAARFLPSATARKTTANAATSKAASSDGFLFLPAIIFHDKPGHGFYRFLFKHKTLALIPAPGLFILAHAAQPDFNGQLPPSESEQLPA